MFDLAKTARDFRRAVDAAHNICRFDPHHVPVVYCGCVFTLHIDSVQMQPAADLDARDFVLGMEALGVRFWITKAPDGTDRLLRAEGYHMLPAHWISRAEKLRAAFPVDRDAEAIAFMRQRGDVAVGEEPDPDPLASFLNDWQGAIAVYEALPVWSDEEDEAYREQHVAPLEERVANGTMPAATTAAGAALALRKALAFEDMEDMETNLVKAALAFLEGGSF